MERLEYDLYNGAKPPTQEDLDRSYERTSKPNLCPPKRTLEEIMREAIEEYFATAPDSKQTSLSLDSGG
ncbi:MAG: hypothetical protein OXH08_10470 [Gammaproteobacteria bacterium]|nr:hypothetical protein [Gammaproteobacteria bacterium]MDE0649244.1 hypothetical protein [Gammaproteobacteria bacterium]